MSSTASMQSETVISRVVGWTFGILFVILGILNLIFVHPVPGLFYLVLSLLYCPQTKRFLIGKFGFAIPLAVKVIVGLFVLWGTLAVTDLAEMAGL